MDSQNFLFSRENPRPLSFSTASIVSSKPNIPNEIAQKPSAPILVGRFKALLKEREDEFRASSGDDAPVPPPSTEEIVQFYQLLLSDLTCNLKPIITDLTIIAELQVEHARGIADAICTRILEVPADQKLPSLYLLDSIVKNVGQEYIRYFSSRLPEIFCEAYRQVHPKLHNDMRRLFGTWSNVFPPSVLRKIEAKLQFSQAVNSRSSISDPLRASESRQATHGIHINPKYLQQLEHSSIDSVGDEKLESTVNLGLANFGRGAKMHQPLSSRLGRSLPSGIRLDRPLSATKDECAVDNSSSRIVERDPLSHPAFDYGVGKAGSRGEELSGCEPKHHTDDGRNQFQVSMSGSLSNGHQRQNLKALIDAYGSDKNDETFNNKPLFVERQDINGLNKVVSASWQNTEEEEFDWEDMSPTLADHSRNNDFLPSSIGFSREKPVISAATSERNTRRSWSSRSQLPPMDDSSVIAGDKFVYSSYGRGSPVKASGYQNQTNRGLSSRPPLDAWNIRGRASNIQISPVSNIQNSDINPYGTRSALSRMGSALESNVEIRPTALPASLGMRPPVNVHAVRPPTLNHTFPLDKHVKSQFEPIHASSSIVNNGQNNSSFLDSVENKVTGLSKLHQLPTQLAGQIPFNQKNHGQAPQIFHSPDVQEKLLRSQAPAALQFSHGSSLLGHTDALSTAMLNSLPAVQFPIPVQNIANNSSQLRGGNLMPLPPVSHPAMSLTIPHSNAGPIGSSQQPGGAFSGLINSLMAQGLISLTNQPAKQDSVGTEFNPDVLKIRHESAINALYGDLPRQCTTCGLRFKCQEEHSSHMDWHVTKNRMSKNHKQKPSRKWFVSESMWLSGAEALGTESVPGFLPSEILEEKRDDEELAVPADEDQNTCALCGEPFDEFYSDETEEWMYRGAVYNNAPKGTVAGMDRSQLGPIVHAKCRSESSVVPSEDNGLDERGTNEEDIRRKRMRS
ncbi:polyadenylation and cleavage factor homolog 4 isoform X2 [Neltuma alba]|uniref:polyadenylation and cleavage factor homolog 4 isoform X2 n=1 Tax=Neltuma alba TaxID=207710 RepID=UPI0010A483F3|nr:polyadenylation and cleavage factor homolog 4-like isoform X2 [Prosopis alba]